jgi:hypothetical protein
MINNLLLTQIKQIMQIKMDIYKFAFSVLILFLIAEIANAQNERHRLKVDANINELFKGNGFVFESIGYEYAISRKMSIGGWVGLDATSSKLTQKDVANRGQQR